nr:cytochrome P450 [uncultured bacterium]
MRITLEEFFGELFPQFAGFEPAGEPGHLHSNFIAGVTHPAARRDPPIFSPLETLSLPYVVL